MKTYAVILCGLFMHCAQPMGVATTETPTVVEQPTEVAQASYTPTFPVPLHTNEFTDSSFVTNGTSYWKTSTSLNRTIPVHSGTCFNKGEWVKDILICHQIESKVDDTVPVQVYRVNIGPIEQGSIYEVLSQMEFTNPMPYGLMVGTVVIASSNPDQTTNYVQDETQTDPIIVPTNGENCIPSVHHCSPSKVGSFMVDESMKNYFGDKDVWIIVLTWSNVSLSVIEQDTHLFLEQNYGSLSVIKH